MKVEKKDILLLISYDNWKTHNTIVMGSVTEIRYSFKDRIIMFMNAIKNHYS